MTDLTDPTSKEIERLDYVWLRGRRNCNLVKPTGLFNADTRDERTRRARVPSDHTGVIAVLECPTTTAQRSAADGATMPTLPSTTTIGAAGDAATKAAIAERVHDRLRRQRDEHRQETGGHPRRRPAKPFFLQSYAAQKAIASRIKLRIDRIAVTDVTHADVEYSLLLDGAAVLDHLPGGAVKVGDTWFVTRKTYCDVSTQGEKTIPEPCREEFADLRHPGAEEPVPRRAANQQPADRCRVDRRVRGVALMPDDDDVPAPLDADAVSILHRDRAVFVLRAPGPGAAVLRDEHVGQARCRQCAPAEVDGAGEAAGDERIPRRVESRRRWPHRRRSRPSHD